jgi:hypothetical protein
LRDRLGRLGVLVDDASEDLAAADLGTWRDGGWLVKPRGKLVPGLVGPVIVVVRRVLGQHGARMPLAVDQQPVGALCPGRSHEPLGETIRPGVCGGAFTILIPAAANTASNAPVNFAYRMGRAARCLPVGRSFSARPSSEPRGRFQRTWLSSDLRRVQGRVPVDDVVTGTQIVTVLRRIRAMRACTASELDTGAVTCGLAG